MEQGAAYASLQTTGNIGNSGATEPEDYYERVKFQFRGEATNVFNFVNLNAPGATLSSTSSFGVITSAGNMRVLQVGGRLLF